MSASVTNTDFTFDGINIKDSLSLNGSFLYKLGFPNEEIEIILNRTELILRYVSRINGNISKEHCKLCHPVFNNNIYNHIFNYNPLDIKYYRHYEPEPNVFSISILHLNDFQYLHEYHISESQYISMDDLNIGRNNISRDTDLYSGIDLGRENSYSFSHEIPNFNSNQHLNNLNGSIGEVWFNSQYNQYYSPEEEKKKEEANKKSRKLFLNTLDKNQKKTFKKHGYIDIKSKDNNAIKYRLHTEYLDYNVEVLFYEQSIGMFCCQMEGGTNLPNYDHFVAQKLWIENNEEYFIKNSNIKNI